MSLVTSCSTATGAYADFACFYDRYVAHDHYATWVFELLDAAARHGFAGGSALDVGCGTGLSTAPLTERCAAVAACEPVEQMARLAERRLPGVRVHRAPVTELGALGAFDLVLMINDVVNYVPGSELDAAFAQLAANLAPSGVLVFDANTLATYRGIFARTDIRVAGDVLFVWRGRCRPSFGPGERAEATLDAFVGAGPPIRSRHVQFHHPPGRIEAALRRAGLRVTESYADRSAPKHIYIATPEPQKGVRRDQGQEGTEGPADPVHHQGRLIAR